MENLKQELTTYKNQISELDRIIEENTQELLSGNEDEVNGYNQ